MSPNIIYPSVEIEADPVGIKEECAEEVNMEVEVDLQWMESSSPRG